MSSFEATYNQSRQQLFMFAFVLFGAMVAAIVASAFITMSLMKGEVANALSQTATNNQPVMVSGCSDPSVLNESSDDSANSESVQASNSAPASSAVTATVSNVSNITNKSVDNSVTSTFTSVDNSKGKTIVNDNSYSDNSVTQVGLINTNLQDNSHTTNVLPVNIIDNTLKVNSDNDTDINSNNNTQNNVVAPVLSPFTDVTINPAP
jgi:hypothetical protein